MENRFAPPGVRVKLICAIYGGILGILLGRGCVFFYHYFHYRDTKLYWVMTGIRLLIPEEKMPDFNEFAAGYLNVLVILFVACAALAVLNYVRFHTEKSIYLMKRIPNKAELHVRCLALPVIFLTVGIIIAVVLYHLYVYVFFHCTPEGHLPENMDPSFWRVLL